MKIAWIVPGFQSDANDRCIPALTDLAHRVATEHDLTVFALQYPGRDDCYQIGRVKIEAFKAGSRLPKLRRLSPLYRAIRAIRRNKPDLIHAFWAAEPALAGVVAAKSLNQSLIVSCMGGEPARLPTISYGAGLHWLDRFYLSVAARGAAHITCGSQAQANLLQARYPKLKPLIRPLGIDVHRFAFNIDTLPNPRQLLAVGSLLPVKGHANLVKAMAIVHQKQPDVHLNIVGEGSERPKLEKLINELGLAGTVSLKGSIPAEQMPLEYSNAGLFVLSSYYESQCVALGEALACGLPAIAPPVGYAPELLGDNAAGLLAQDNSPSTLATAILTILSRETTWAAMGQAARAKAESISVEKCTQAFLELYLT